MQPAQVLGLLPADLCLVVTYTNAISHFQEVQNVSPWLKHLSNTWIIVSMML